jgi:hypothetical protein
MEDRYMRKRLIDEFFTRAEGFVASFKQIEREGFFSDLMVDLGGMEGYFPRVNIRASGYIPDHPSDSGTGLSPYIDVADVLNKVRAQSMDSGYVIDSGIAKVEQKDWPKWDRAGNNIKGKLGQHIHLELYVSLRWKGKGKPK